MIRDWLIKREIDLHEVDTETHNRRLQNYKSRSSPGYQLLFQFIILYPLL